RKSLFPVLDGLSIFDRSGLEEIGECMQRCVTKSPDPLCDLINLYHRIVINLFELCMQFEEFLPGDVPVKSPRVDVEYLVIRKQNIQLICEFLSLVFVQSD